MARILVASTPLLGHLRPALGVAGALQRRGHDVDVLAAPTAAAMVLGHGFAFLPVPGSERDAPLVGAPLVGAARWRPPWVHARRDVIARFVGPLAAQAEALAAALGAVSDHSARYDAVVADTAFLGVLPELLGRAAGHRPPVLGLSSTPISTVSVDAAPFGSGLRNTDSRFARRRNRQVNWLLHRGPLRPIQTALDDALAPFGVPAGAAGYFDLLTCFDRVFQLSLPELEYPRRELPSSVVCVGPLPIEAAGWTPPAWWSELGDARGVVLITQGTVDNGDAERLIVPAVRALRRSGLQLVVTTGRPPSASLLARLAGLGAERLHVTDFVPYGLILPRVDLVITNGGWGGVQQAAAHGVPVIVAGATEEKPEVGARVAWSGLGLDLRTGTPSARRIRRAVEIVTDRPRFAAAAREIAQSASRRRPPLELVVTGVEDAIAARAGAAAEDLASTGHGPERVPGPRSGDGVRPSG